MRHYIILLSIIIPSILFPAERDKDVAAQAQKQRQASQGSSSPSVSATKLYRPSELELEPASGTVRRTNRAAQAQTYTVHNANSREIFQNNLWGYFCYTHRLGNADKTALEDSLYQLMTDNRSQGNVTESSLLRLQTILEAAGEQADISDEKSSQDHVNGLGGLVLKALLLGRTAQRNTLVREREANRRKNKLQKIIFTALVLPVISANIAICLLLKNCPDQEPCRSLVNGIQDLKKKAKSNLLPTAVNKDTIQNCTTLLPKLIDPQNYTANWILGNLTSTYQADTCKRLITQVMKMQQDFLSGLKNTTKVSDLLSTYQTQACETWIPELLNPQNNLLGNLLGDLLNVDEINMCKNLITQTFDQNAGLLTRTLSNNVALDDLLTQYQAYDCQALVPQIGTIEINPGRALDDLLSDNIVPQRVDLCNNLLTELLGQENIDGLLTEQRSALHNALTAYQLNHCDIWIPQVLDPKKNLNDLLGNILGSSITEEQINTCRASITQALGLQNGALGYILAANQGIEVTHNAYQEQNCSSLLPQLLDFQNSTLATWLQQKNVSLSILKAYQNHGCLSLVPKLSDFQGNAVALTQEELLDNPQLREDTIQTDDHSDNNTLILILALTSIVSSIVSAITNLLH